MPGLGGENGQMAMMSMLKDIGLMAGALILADKSRPEELLKRFTIEGRILLTRDLNPSLIKSFSV